MLSEFSKSQSMCRLRAIVLLVIVASVFGGCGTDAPKPGDRLPASDVNEDSLPWLSHVHGLGINPGDGDLYVATHFGLWRIVGDRPKRVGDAAHDFMGFSVAGEDRFLASGHPQGARDLPAHLGLIESTDAGASWKSRSLMGEADFHVLRMGAKRVYGWSSSTGKLAVTSDLRRWSDRGSISLIDLAIDPEDDQRVIAAVAPSDSTIELRMSNDAGASWSRIDHAPDLIRLNWTDRRVWGVTPNGDVWKNTDGNGDWEQVGSVDGDVEAITAGSDRWYAAAGGAIQESRDEGASWDLIVDY
jgi:hypothetical protein